MLRPLALFFAAGLLVVRGSDPLPLPEGGASAPVTQPHVTAELIPENTVIAAGQPFDVILHLHMDPGWHTYWINPGDAGLATTIDWQLPEGFTAGPIQWPTPEIHALSTEVTYGYEGDVYLLTTITPPKTALPPHLPIKAHAEWLVCQEACIPGKADLGLTVDTNPLNLRPAADNHDLFAQARARLPVQNQAWDVQASYVPKLIQATQGDGLLLSFRPRPGVTDSPAGKVRFFPEQPNVLSAQDSDNVGPQAGGSGYLSIALQQNGEKPDKLSGVLVSDLPLMGTARAVYLPAFSVAPTGAVSPGLANAHGVPASTHPPGAQPWLVAVLGAAFLGGLILNLMPCVLPVLSLKVFSLIRHAGENSQGAWKQGAAFTVGVVISFWALGGLLLILRAAGNHLGWGFQMQSPPFVLGLILLFFVLALNLLGAFEIGTSLVGLDAKASGRLHGTFSSFLNGALATLAATPCTAPFMGSSLGFAAQQPALIALLVFTFLGLGMATPYLALTAFPGALRFVPKPGRWMETLRQFMGFLLLGTVIFLLYVFGALAGTETTPLVLFTLLVIALGAWLYGKWQTSSGAGLTRWVHLTVAVGALALALGLSWSLAHAEPVRMAGNAPGNSAWGVYSAAAVDEALAQNRPVFVDFTAAWCLSCKVNERVALEASAVQQAFAQKKVALLRADWTRSDPKITEILNRFHRDGVPLYLLYSPQAKDDPQVLPEVLTPGIVLEALNKL